MRNTCLNEKFKQQVGETTFFSRRIMQILQRCISRTVLSANGHQTLHNTLQICISVCFFRV